MNESPAAAAPLVTVTSFGYGHAAPPEADVVYDVRRHFRDPHVRPGLRGLTGDDPAVIEAVMSTPGVERLVRSIAHTVRAFLDGPQPGPVTIAVGCVGGRHRSAVIADEAASRLQGVGITAAAVHRDKHRLVIARPGAGAQEGREFTHPDVFTLGVAQGWAEAEADPARIDWAERQARAAIPFEVIGGRPVNPCEKTGITRGRNEMGFWGEQKMADALATVTLLGTRYLLMIERGDGYGWAVPGGHVEPGETGERAAVRELAEETGMAARLFPFATDCLWPHDVPAGQVPADIDGRLAAVREMPPRYVPDPRSSDEAWAVTIPVLIDLGDRDEAPAVRGADDARRAEWIPADTYEQLRRDLARHFGGRVFAAHVAMLRDFLGGQDSEED
jgi:8-oxo-dGTP pyrophosphatase MutT (NUDIX family)